jgi:hypothetical protein
MQRSLSFRPRLAAAICVAFALAALPAYGGGAWIPAPGDGEVQLGYSRKTAHTSWDSRGEGFVNLTQGTLEHHHDFRYGYLSGEVGLRERLSFRFLVTYLDGFEGPLEDLERNTGASDAWFGFKYRLRGGAWPMALGATLRTPVFYDLPGPYSRYLYNADGSFRGVSPEWRGVLKEDYALSYLISHSWLDGRAWLSGEIGYNYRRGAPSDEVPLSFEVGYPLPFLQASVKASTVWVQPVGNSSPREPNDRFGARPGFDFNNAQHWRAGLSLIVPLGPRWTVEAGYNQWLAGRSARRYEEPFLSIGRKF